MLEKTGKPLRVMVFTVRNSDAQSMPSHACCHVETFENIYMLRFFFLERGFEVCQLQQATCEHFEALFCNFEQTKNLFGLEGLDQNTKYS